MNQSSTQSTQAEDQDEFRPRINLILPQIIEKYFPDGFGLVHSKIVVDYDYIDEPGTERLVVTLKINTKDHTLTGVVRSCHIGSRIIVERSLDATPELFQMILDLSEVEQIKSAHVLARDGCAPALTITTVDQAWIEDIAG